jgi:hypothetical protein
VRIKHRHAAVVSSSLFSLVIRFLLVNLLRHGQYTLGAVSHVSKDRDVPFPVEVVQFWVSSRAFRFTSATHVGMRISLHARPIAKCLPYVAGTASVRVCRREQDHEQEQD